MCIDRSVRRSKRLGPRWFERLRFFICEKSQLDGLQIGSLEGPAALELVEQALTLIKDHDPVRYRRLLQDVDRVIVWIIPAAVGEFNHRTRSCALDPRFVFEDATTVPMIATVIVHEAAHARLAAMGFDYSEARRARIERLCIRREEAFCRRLPDQHARSALLARSSLDEGWSDREMREREIQGSVETLNYLGVPNWLIRSMVALRRWRDSRRRIKPVEGHHSK